MSTYIIRPNTPQSTRIRTLLDDHPITEDVVAFDIQARLRKDEQNYLHSIDTKYPKTLRTRLDTLGRTVAIPAGALGSMYAYAKLSDKIPALRKTFDRIDPVAVPAVALGGFIGGLKAFDALKNPRSRMLDNIEDDIADQQESLTKKILRDPKLLNAYTAEHLRSVRTPAGRSDRMNVLFDKYNFPTKYQHNVKVAADREPPTKYDGGIYFSPQPIRARVGVTNAATKGESVAYNARNAGLAASTAGVLAGGAYLAGLKNPAVSKAALGLMAGGMGAIAGGNLYLKYSDNGRKAEAKLDDLKKHLQARGGLTHFGPTRFGKMKDSDGNEYITRGFTATRPAPTGRLLATQAKP